MKHVCYRIFYEYFPRNNGINCKKFQKKKKQNLLLARSLEIEQRHVTAMKKKIGRNMENWCGQFAHSWISCQCAIDGDVSQRLPNNWTMPRALMSSPTKKKPIELIHVLLEIHLHWDINLIISFEFWFRWTFFVHTKFILIQCLAQIIYGNKVHCFEREKQPQYSLAYINTKSELPISHLHYINCIFSAAINNFDWEMGRCEIPPFHIIYKMCHIFLTACST